MARSAKGGRSTTLSTTPTPARSTRPGRANGTERASGAASTAARRGRSRATASSTATSGLKLSKVSGLTAAHGRLFAGAEMPGIFESRDGGETWRLLSTLEGQPGSEGWNEPTNQPPGHLGIPAILPHPEDPTRYWAIVQGVGIFETTDDGIGVDTAEPRVASRLAAREPRGRLLRPQARDVAGRTRDRLYQQNHVGMHRSDDAGLTWTEITEGLPTEFGFAAAAHPHDRDTFYVIPLDPGHGRCMPEGSAAVWRTRDAGASWQRLHDGLPQHGAHVGVLREGMAIDTHEDAGRVLRHEHGPAVRECRRGPGLARDRELPAGHRIGRGCGRRLSHGRALSPLRRCSRSSPSFRAGSRSTPPPSTQALDHLDERWPGFRDRLCEPGPELRRHIHVYVDRETRDARHGARGAVASRRDRRDQRRLS